MARAALLLALLPLLAPEVPAVRVVNLAPGETLRYPVPILRGEAPDPDGAVLRVVNLSSRRPDRELETTVRGHRFRALAELVPGDNEIRIASPSGEARLRLRYVPPTTPYVVRFVYVIDSGGATDYQSERAGDPQDYAAKIDTAAKILQSLTAERMNDEGFGRKTFALELGADGRVQVRVVRAPKDAAWYRSRGAGENYGEIAGFLERTLPTRRAKNIVLLAFSRYDPATREVAGGVARGGGGYAMFGGLGLFAWPSRLRDVEAAFTDATRVDPSRTNDDSAGRHTYWGLASTTLGAVLHEAGHTFALAHSRDPYDVMSRGFDHLNRVFTVVEPLGAFGEDEVAGFGPISSPRLAWQRWFEPDDRAWLDAPGPAARVDHAAGKVVLTADLGLRALGIDRGLDRNGSGGHASWTLSWPGDPPKRVVLDVEEVRRRAGGREFGLLLVDAHGNVVRCEPPDLLDPADFVRTWRFARETVAWEGPPGFPAMPPGGAEEAARDLAGVRSTTSPHARVDLGARYASGTMRAARGLAILRSKGEARLRMLTGSDDSLRVWINGALVLERSVLREAEPDRDVTDVVLRDGENRVLVEVGNGGGRWAFCMRFEGPRGEPLVVGADGTLRPAGGS